MMLAFHAVARRAVRSESVATARVTRFRDPSEALCDGPGRRDHDPTHVSDGAALARRRAAIPSTAR